MHRSHATNKKKNGPKKFGHWGQHSESGTEQQGALDDIPEEAKHLSRSQIAKRFPDLARKNKKQSRRLNSPPKSKNYWRAED
jgi:hypothetical protein